MTENRVIRTIQAADDAVIAGIIRAALTEFGVNRPGTVFADPATDSLSQWFNKEKAVYYVAATPYRILGGAGIYPLEGSPGNTCELQKMYLSPDARRKGTGKLLMEHCLQFANEQGYEKCYLETMPELQKAVSMYEKFGFRYLNAPLGNTGHFSCHIWMIKELG